MATFSSGVEGTHRGGDWAIIERSSFASGQANDGVMIHKLQFDDPGASTAKLNQQKLFREIERSGEHEAKNAPDSDDAASITVFDFGSNSLRYLGGEGFETRVRKNSGTHNRSKCFRLKMVGIDSQFGYFQN